MGTPSVRHAGPNTTHDPFRPRAFAASPLALACIAAYLVTVLALFLTIRHRNDGVFTYSLDDPYIHLALAQQLAHGHYGINPGEASSPSSSILWPFLLIPAAAAPWHMYLPLAWNILFGSLAAGTLGTLAGRWPLPLYLRAALAVVLMLLANLAGLTFIGMEHTLQVLLAILCAAGLLEAYAGRPIPTWSLAAAALGPLVRYESLALTAAVALALYSLRRRRAAALVLGISLIGPALFSLFLLSRGLPALPSSVLVKAHVYQAADAGWLQAARDALDNFTWSDIPHEWWNQAAVTAILTALAVLIQDRPRRIVLRAAALAGLLQLVAGGWGWFHRYEVYALILTTLIAVTALIEIPPKPFIPTLIPALLLLAWPYMKAVRDTPIAASNVYQQQYQMQRFVSNVYRRAVAVNDIGWVSFRHPPGVYILDLWGLALPSAAREPDKNDEYLDAITRDHAVGLAIIYPDWFESIPDDWTPVATLCMTSNPILSRPCTTFYSTALGNPAELRRQLTAFAPTLPTTAVLTSTQTQ